jgi:hypothetical protein
MVMVKEIDNYYGTTMFEVYFALHLNSFMECAMVQSRIRERIGEAFPPASAGDEDASAQPSDTLTDPASPTTPVAKISESVIVKELRKIQSRMRGT